MRLIFVIIFFTFSLGVKAGGDVVLGKITSFKGDVSNLILSFDSTEERLLIKGCKSFTVKLSYSRVPWYSWVPFIKYRHPTKKDTASAIDYLQKAYKEQKNIYLGYMGSGLAPTDEQCVFLSKGLSLEGNEEHQFVLSFHNPV